MKSLIKRQRNNYIEAATAGKHLTETRISATNFRNITITFNGPVSFSKDDDGSGKEFCSKHKFIVVAYQGEEAEDEDVNAEPIIDHWNITKCESDRIEIGVQYNDPLKVSTDDKPDLLFVSLDLSGLRDANGKAFPSGIVKYIEIPT